MPVKFEITRTGPFEDTFNRGTYDLGLVRTARAFWESNYRVVSRVGDVVTMERADDTGNKAVVVLTKV